MSSTAMLEPLPWAQQLFGAARLGDPRRTARVIQMAAAMAAQPAASIPEQMGSWAATHAAYAFLDNEAVSFTALAQPGWEATRQATRAHPLVLLVHDGTVLDYTAYADQIAGLGQTGNGHGRGYLVHSTLAIDPSQRTVLGLVYQEPSVRGHAPKGETSVQRLKRERESQVWARAAAACGAAPAGTTWVHVGDQGSDIYGFFAAIRATGSAFLLRVCQDRKLDSPAALPYLRQQARQLPAVDQRELVLSPRHGHAERRVQLALAFADVVLHPPHHGPRYPPLAVSLIRVWEPEPVDPEAPIEWLLLSSLPVPDLATAWERVGWYTCRWLIEDFHMCLKTGCRIEARRLEHIDRLWRLLALCAPIAVRLVQLRQTVRATPDAAATTVLPAEMVAVVSRRLGVPVELLTVDRALREMARMGGWLGRTRDGPPGWRTLWRGWQKVALLAEGFMLASRDPPTSV